MEFRVSLLLIVALGLAGCSADQPLNPSFPLTVDGATQAIEAMKKSPVKLSRPVIVLGGYMDFGITTPKAQSIIQEIGGGENVRSVHFFLKGDFDRCREHLLGEVEAAFPSNDPNWTTEVDVVAGSMGGIVARYSALPPESSSAAPQMSRKRLKIARLFTVSTPHLGADMANFPSFDSLVVNMRHGSDFLHNLDAALPACGYELYPYVRLNDVIVGAPNTAPPGMVPWWVANQPAQSSHLGSFKDDRIIADIARRLRGETPFTSFPPAPLP